MTNPDIKVLIAEVFSEKHIEIGDTKFFFPFVDFVLEIINSSYSFTHLELGKDDNQVKDIIELELEQFLKVVNPIKRNY